MSVKITGGDTLMRALAKNANLTEVKRVVKSNGAQLTRNAQRLAPVDTGALKNSILQKIEGGGLASRSSAGMHYANYVEKGTRFMSAQPYMKPSFDLQAPMFIKELEVLFK